MNDQPPPSAPENFTCQNCSELLIEFAHNELSRALYVVVASHLSACSGCALQFCQLRVDLDGITHAYTEPVPVQLRAAVRRRVLAKVRRPWWHRIGRLFLQPIPAYGALGLAMIPALLWMGSTIQSPSPQAPLTTVWNKQDSVSSEVRVYDYDASDTLRPSETMY